MQNEITHADLQKYVGKKVLLKSPLYEIKVTVQISMGPTYFLVDRDGKSVATVYRSGDIDMLDAKIFEL